MPLLQRNRGRGPRSIPALIRRPRALTAAAEPAARSQGALRRLDEPWQRTALARYDDSGELWNPSQYYARSMERIRYFPAIRNDRGVPVEVTEGPLLELFNRIQSPSCPRGDLSELAGSYARLQFVIGDGLLTVSEDADGGEVWEYLSPMEMRLNPNGNPKDPQSYRRIRAIGVPPEELVEAADNQFEPLSGNKVHVWRLWRRHPQYSQSADSPVRPILDLYEVLSRLTLAVGAEASSRAAQRGLLFVPDELSFGPSDPSQEENPEEDPLIRELQETMARAIRNPGTAEAMSPFVLRAPGVTTTTGGPMATADLIRWIALGSGDRYVEGEMWDRTISRIAGGLDLPKEMLTGITDVSHWSAWFLDETGFRQHTGPTVVRFCNDIGSAYLRPAAIDEGIDNAEQVTVWFDPAQAVNHPDQTGTARDAHDRLVISDDYYRKQIGAGDDDAPNAAELKRRTEIKLKEDPYTGQAVAQGGATAPPAGGRGGDVVKEPPQDSQTRPPGNSAPSPGGPASMAAMVVGAAHMQIDRARELAGQRLWRRAQSCEDCRDKARDVPAALIAATLGAVQVRDVIEGHVSEGALVAGIGDAFARRLRAWDIDGGWPEQLGAMVEQHALRTLYEMEPPPLPSGFVAAVQKAIGG